MPNDISAVTCNYMRIVAYFTPVRGHGLHLYGFFGCFVAV